MDHSTIAVLDDRPESRAQDSIQEEKKATELRSDNVQADALDTLRPDDTIEPELHITTWLVVVAINILSAATLALLVGAGAFAQNITATLGHANRSTWFSTICFTFTVLTGLPVAQGSDLFGRRYFIIGLCILAVAGNILIATSPSFTANILGFCLASPVFAVQGLTYAIVSEVLPRKWRAYATGSIGASQGAIAIACLLGGSKLASSSPEGWRKFFYLTTGLFAFSLLLIVVVYRPPPRPAQLRYSKAERLHAMDWIGYALLTLGLCPLLVGISFGNNPEPWTAPVVLAPTLVGVAFFIAFCLYEWKGTSTGVVAHALFGDRNLSVQLIGTFIEGAAFSGLNSYYIFQLIVFFHLDAYTASLRFATFFGSTLVCAVIFGRIITVTKRIRYILLFGITVSMAGTIGLYFVKPNATGDHLSWIVAMLGGSASCLIVQNTAAQMSAPPELMGAVSALMLCTRSFGGSLFGAIYTSLFNTTLSKNIAAKVPAAAVQAGLSPQYIPEFIGDLTSSNMKALMQIPGINDSIIMAGGAALVESFRLAFQKVWITSAVLWAVCLLVSWFTIEPSKHFNAIVDASAEANLMYRSARGELDQKHAEEFIEHGQARAETA